MDASSWETNALRRLFRSEKTSRIISVLSARLTLCTVCPRLGPEKKESGWPPPSPIYLLAQIYFLGDVAYLLGHLPASGDGNSPLHQGWWGPRNHISGFRQKRGEECRNSGPRSEKRSGPWQRNRNGRLCFRDCPDVAVLVEWGAFGNLYGFLLQRFCTRIKTSIRYWTRGRKVGYFNY